MKWNFICTCGENGFIGELNPHGIRGDGCRFAALSEVLVTGVGETALYGFGDGIDPTGVTAGFQVPKPPLKCQKIL